MRDLEDALIAVLDCFRLGRAAGSARWSRPRIDRILFAATKADHLHHSDHDRLEAILTQMTGARHRAGRDAGAEVDVIALAAVRATREALSRRGRRRAVDRRAPLPGEVGRRRAFRRHTEIAFFPGDLPATDSVRTGGDFDSIRFRLAARWR